MQLLIGMSMSRYLPATGTAGLLRVGERIEPRAAAAAEDESENVAHGGESRRESESERKPARDGENAAGRDDANTAQFRGSRKVKDEMPVSIRPLRTGRECVSVRILHAGTGSPLRSYNSTRTAITPRQSAGGPSEYPRNPDESPPVRRSPGISAPHSPPARPTRTTRIRTSKVGDYATYKMTTKVAGMDITGTTTQTVTASPTRKRPSRPVGRSASWARTSIFRNKSRRSTSPSHIDPTKIGGGALPAGTDVKVEKGKEGKEKIKVGGKEYDATWTEYKMKAKAVGQDVATDLKVWMSKDVPMGMVKMTMNGDVAGQKIEMTMEMTETGNKK